MLFTPQLALSSTGQQIWSATYDAFGKATITGNYQINLRAAGQYQDDETNLYYNWYRYYNPSLGRYISSDPLGLAAGTNTYIYVNGNPINYTDPMGLRADGITGGGSVEYMMPYFGFAVNGSARIGWYMNKNGNNGYIGVTASGGINFRFGRYIFQYPEHVIGQENTLHEPNGFSGIAGVFYSNAECVAQMKGDSFNYNVNPHEALSKISKFADNIPFLNKFNLLPSFQHSVSGNITTSSVSLSPREVGFGSGASAYLTNTVILYDGSKR